MIVNFSNYYYEYFFINIIVIFYHLLYSKFTNKFIGPAMGVTEAKNVKFLKFHWQRCVDLIPSAAGATMNK